MRTFDGAWVHTQSRQLLLYLLSGQLVNLYEPGRFSVMRLNDQKRQQIG